MYQLNLNKINHKAIFVYIDKLRSMKALIYTQHFMLFSYGVNMRIPNNLHQIGAISILMIVAASPSWAQTYTREQRGNWCKNQVINLYDTNRGDVAITSEQGPYVSWRMRSTGKSGRCVFNSRNAFVRLEETPQRSPYRRTGQIYWNAQARRWIAPDGGICNSCTPANGFPNPPKSRNGFFYLPNDQKWYDPDGRVCNTCNPQNGFPIPPRY